MGLVYSFLDTHATLTGPGAGPISLGAGAGISEEGITVDFTEDKDTMRIGADGTTIHNLNPGRAASVLVRLLKVSPANSVLSALYAFQTSSSLYHAQNVIVISNSMQQDILTLKSVAFAKFPRIDYPKEAAMNEWRFNASEWYPVLGVNLQSLVQLGSSVGAIAGFTAFVR